LGSVDMAKIDTFDLIATYKKHLFFLLLFVNFESVTINYFSGFIFIKNVIPD